MRCPNESLSGFIPVSQEAFWSTLRLAAFCACPFQIILKPADDEGALDVFVAVISGPPGPRPEVLIPSIRAPMLILWGDDDPFTPVDGPVGTYFSTLPETRTGTKFVLLRDVGHCPQDDRHEEVAVELVPWLQAL